MSEEEITFEKSSGNVYADFGVEHAEERKAKWELVWRIRSLIAARGITQGEAAVLLGAHQPDVSNIMNGHVKKLTFDRLFRYLDALGQPVHIRLAACGGLEAAGLQANAAGAGHGDAVERVAS